MILSWIFVFLWGGIIFYLSSIPNLNSGLEADFLLRKLAHIFVYFVLVALIFNALSKTFFYLKKQKTVFDKLIFASFLSLIYAVLDEYHQTFVFGRSGSPKDILIDFLGIILFSLFFCLYKFKFIFRSKDKQN